MRQLKRALLEKLSGAAGDAANDAEQAAAHAAQVAADVKHATYPGIAVDP